MPRSGQSAQRDDLAMDNIRNKILSDYFKEQMESKDRIENWSFCVNRQDKYLEYRDYLEHN